MKKIAIVYHSAHGHTGHIAQRVAEGATTVPGVEVELLEASVAAVDPERLAHFDGLVMGSPTYLGGVSGPFKSFMDTTGRMWRLQQLRGKLAAGFTVSSLPAGDKQSTLQSMFVFAMQHGMVWIGNPILPVIKVCANPDTYRRMQDDMDVDAGRILEGRATLDVVGREIVDLIVRVGNGQATRSEELGHQEFILTYKSFEPLGPSCLPA